MNTFRLIRRVLKSDKDQLWQIPFVFSGTNTRFNNFIPSHTNSPSVRDGIGPNDEVPVGVGILLFEPYILTATFDAYAKQMNKGPPMKSNWKNYVESCDYQYHLCNLGRPLWGGFLNAELEILIGDSFAGKDLQKCIPEGKLESFGTILSRIHRQALSKMPYSKDNSNVLERVECAVSIAHVIAGSGFLYGALASALVEKRMAVLLDYRYDTSQVRVAYPSEPVLAIASLAQLHNNTLSILDDLLLTNDCLIGSIGDIGEFVARIILLLSLGEITLNKPFCSVSTFLENLIGRSKVEALWKDPAAHSVLGGVVCFSHFSRIDEICDDPVENLCLLVSLHTALVTRKNFKGIDMVLPVVLENGGMGSINVQVKSYAIRLHPKDIRNIVSKITKSEFSSEEIPSLSLVMNLSPNLEYSCEVEPSTSDKKNLSHAPTVIIQGLSKEFPLIQKSPELEHKLKHMVSAGRFRMDFHRNEAVSRPVAFSLRDWKKYYWERLSKTQSNQQSGSLTVDGQTDQPDGPNPPSTPQAVETQNNLPEGPKPPSEPPVVETQTIQQGEPQAPLAKKRRTNQPGGQEETN